MEKTNARPTYAKVIVLLQRGNLLTKLDAMKSLRIANRTAAYTLAQIHADQLCYIESWKRSGNVWIPCYKWGQGKDAVKPEAQKRNRSEEYKKLRQETLKQRLMEMAQNQIFNLIVIRA